MCKNTFREALTQIGITEQSRRLQAACDELKLELTPLANCQPAQMAALAESMAKVLVLVEVLAPVVGRGLIGLAECDALQSMQREIHHAARRA